MAILDQRDSFYDFNTSKLLRLSELYQNDFNSMEITKLEHELHLYIENMQHDERFANLKGVSDFDRVMVETRKHPTFPLVY